MGTRLANLSRHAAHKAHLTARGIESDNAWITTECVMMNLQFPYAHELRLPCDAEAETLYDWLATVCVEGSGKEIAGYLASDFLRFIYTLDLFRSLGGQGRRAIEFGANPYFMSMLSKEFSNFEWTYSNWFEGQPKRLLCQSVTYRDLSSGRKSGRDFHYFNFNSENGHFPLQDEGYDVVLYCEILEHLTNDPSGALRKIRRLLKPGGHLILTTPNVARFENVVRLLSGENIYDPYSGYGPYGRHNREYTRDELRRLLIYIGFEIEEIFTSDVHPHTYSQKIDPDIIAKITSERSEDLGQYIFVRARKSPIEGQKLPAWLYRSIGIDRVATGDEDRVASLSARLTLQDWQEDSENQSATVLLAAVNGGSREWDFDSLRLGARAFSEGGNLLREFRGQFTRKISPGGTALLRIEMDFSGLPSRWLEIVIDLVNEHCFWFEDVGSSPIRIIREPGD